MKKMRIFPILVLIASLAFVLFTSCEQDDAKKTARLTYVNWEEGVAYTHLVMAILEDEMDYDVTITAADVGPAYTSVAAGDYDAFMEAWLPGLHASYMDNLGEDLVDLGILYDDAVSGLIVPQYMYDDGVRSISDLRKPEVFEALNGEITGIDAGAGLMITTQEEVMPAYGLDEMGYRLVSSSDAAMMAAIDTAIQREEYIVGLGWQPHSMFGYFDLVILDQDEDIIWGLDNIHVIGRKGIHDDKPELAQFLSNMHISNEDVAALMVAINESNLSTLESARQWKEENPSVWQSWVPSN